MTTNVLIPSIEKQMFIPGTVARIIGCGQNCPAIGTGEQFIESNTGKIQFSQQCEQTCKLTVASPLILRSKSIDSVNLFELLTCEYVN
jgi:hypothetical protein